jgi:hypothetical protein
MIAAFQTDARLMERVLAMLQPRGDRHPDTPLVKLLRRYWPGGRAA